MNVIDKLAKTIIDSSEVKEKNKTSAYDTTAKVVKVEGAIAWVSIPDGVAQTPASMVVNAKAGDEVRVNVSGGKAYVTGNITSPPTDDNYAMLAEEQAKRATASAQSASKQATVAYEAAGSAVRDAGIARDSADQAVKDAATAHEAANSAQASADRAQASADTAEENAQTAIRNAGLAQTAADNAQRDADSANRSANAALTQLSVVEDVVGVLEWISEHATYKASEDTEVIAGKMYFTKNGDTYTPIANPTGNPSTAGYYEIDNIDEAVSNYVSSHLALTNAGLWVVNDNNSYKILLASDGMKVYDASGNLVSTFGESISFSSSRAQYIGNNTAYIVFDPDGNGGQGELIIGGSTIQMGSRTLEDVLGKTLIYDHTYEYVRDSNNKPVSANFTAFLYRGGVDVKTEYPTSSFTWYLKKEEKGTGAVTETLIGTGYTCSVSLSECGYGAEVVGKFTMTDDANVLNSDGDNLTDANNNNLSVRATGDSVRVRDLSVSTTIFPTDKLMVVGAEDEHLVSVQTLQDYLNANLTKQVLFNTTDGWNAQASLVSDANTLYVYTDHQVDAQGNHVAGIKAGDGNAYVVDLPFTDAVATEHIEDTTRHITASERTFWNNKVRCYYASGDNLIFTTA